mgnify:CR=1 FL=1
MNITFKFTARANSKGGARINVVLYKSNSHQNTKFKLPIVLKTINDWDASRQRLKNSAPSALNINGELSQLEMKGNDLLNDWRRKNIQPTFDQFKKAFLATADQKNQNESFIHFIKEHLITAGYSYNTNRSYNTLINLLQQYDEHITFQEINYDFLNRFKFWLSKEKKNVPNSINKKLAQLRHLIYEAMKLGNMSTTPFEHYSIQQVQTNKVALEIEEVQHLQYLYQKNKVFTPGEHNVLRYFLFACYTAMRYSDVLNFNTARIINNNIEFEMVKGGDVVKLPIMPAASKLLPVHPETKFRVITGQQTNMHLKEIMRKAEIAKHITFHAARHTFGSVAINSGLDVAIVSKLMGHRNISTTMIYAHVTDDTKQKAIAQWGKKKLNR